MSATDDTCHPATRGAPPITPVPTRGRVVTPKTPIRAQAMHDARVKPTTHGLRRRRTSDIAPNTGMAATTSSDAMPFAVAYSIVGAPRSSMSQRVK